MNKAIGYIRVSTTEQASEGVSLEAQRAKIAAWAVANDYELVAIHEDAGITGTSMEKRAGAYFTWLGLWFEFRICNGFRCEYEFK